MAVTLSRPEEGGGMRITERRKRLVHISLYARGLPSWRWRGPTTFEGRGCRRSVTPSDGSMSLLGGRSNVPAVDFNHDLARQSTSTFRAMYVQQILGRHHVPIEHLTTDYPDLAQPGGCCGMIPPLVGISGIDLCCRREFAARHREGDTLGQSGYGVDRSASACRPMCVAVARAAVPRGLRPAPRHRRSVPVPVQLASTTGLAGRRSVWRAED
jgi:hypothetical protein